MAKSFKMLQILPCWLLRVTGDGQRGGGGATGQEEQHSTDTELDYTPHVWDRERKQLDGIEEAFRRVWLTRLEKEWSQILEDLKKIRQGSLHFKIISHRTGRKERKYLLQATDFRQERCDLFCFIEGKYDLIYLLLFIFKKMLL